MKFISTQNIEKRSDCDITVVPFFCHNKKAKVAASVPSLANEWKFAVDSRDFKGKKEQTMLLYSQSLKEKRILLLGLGDEKSCSIESLRRSYSAFVKRCLHKDWKSSNVILPNVKGIKELDVASAIIDSLYFSNYEFDYKSTSTTSKALQSICLCGIGKEALSYVKYASDVFSGVNLTKDLVNGNADEITPQAFCKLAKDLEKSNPSIKTTILDKKRLEKEKLGLILAVNRSSKRDPALIIMEYTGNPSSKKRGAIIGKGVTYDTGGLTLKSTPGMLDMKCDMGGAGLVFGVMQAIAKLKLKINLIAAVPTTENDIGSNSYKLGDVYSSYHGNTVEVTNTDAEGRLILADAVAYVEKNYNPTFMMDFATLTGAVEIAIGDERAGIFTTDKTLEARLMESGDKTGESLWPFPMDEEYAEPLKSDIADTKNSGGRKGGAIQGAHFIKKFVKSTPHVHVDIAGVAYLDKPRRYHVTRATGFGVRLMVEMLQKYYV